MDFKLIKLKCDVEDRQSRLTEHGLLNDDLEYLTHCIIKKDGEWCWLVTNTVGNELKFHTDDEKFYCPYCMEELYIKCAYSKEIETHLCHYSNVDNECHFKAKFKCKSDKKYIYEGTYGPETNAHKNLKSTLRALIELQEELDYNVYLEKPVGFKIHGELYPYIEFEYKQVKIVRVEEEVQIVKKDEQLDGFRADLNFYDKQGNVYFIEVTATNGKSRGKYYPLWRKGRRPVYEIYAFKHDLKLGKKEFGESKNILLTSLKINGEIATEGLTIAYDPIYHEGIEALMKAQKQADHEREKIRKKEVRTDAWNNLISFKKHAMRVLGIYMKQHPKSKKWHHYKRIDGKDVFVPKLKYLVKIQGENFVIDTTQELGEVLSKYYEVRCLSKFRA